MIFNTLRLLQNFHQNANHWFSTHCILRPWKFFKIVKSLWINRLNTDIGKFFSYRRSHFHAGITRMIFPLTASSASIIPGKARMRGLRGSSAHNETKKVTEKSHIRRHLPGRKKIGLARATSEAGQPITKSRRWWRKAVPPGTFQCEKGRNDTG